MQDARFDGFDATASLSDALERAADVDALIVLAVPDARPAELLDHVRATAPTARSPT